MKEKLNFRCRLLVSILSLVSIISGVSILSSCSHNAEGLSAIDTVCFESDVLPIFQTNCAIAGCHDGNTEEKKYIDYESIFESVTPYDAEDSEVYKSIIDTWGEEFMPPLPRQPLSKEQRTLIYLWIEQGANNTTCNK